VTTQDVKDLTPGEGAYGAVLDDRAHPISDFLLYVLPHVVVLELPPARAVRAREALERLIVADDVVLAWAVGGAVAYEADDPARLAATIAPRGGEATDAAWLAADGVAARWGAGVDPAALAAPDEWSDEALARVPAALAVAFRASRFGGHGVAFASADPLAECAAAAGRGTWPALDATRLDPLRVAAGRPGEAEFAEARIWNELGLTGALSFTKGCYMGQEIVNRVEAQGRLQRRLVGLELTAPSGVDWAQAELVDATGAGTGVLTHAVRVPWLERTYGFGFARREAWSAGTILTARRADGREARAVVAALPFVRRKGAALADPLVPAETP
jgi:folate-binding protein YgfZ